MGGEKLKPLNSMNQLYKMTYSNNLREYTEFVNIRILKVLTWPIATLAIKG